MSAQDFSKYFAGAQICRASRGWKHTSDGVKLRANSASVITLTVLDRSTVADIAVHQKDRRKFFSHPLYDAPEFQYLSVHILILKAETCEIVNYQRYTSSRDTWLEVPRPSAQAGAPKEWLEPVRPGAAVASCTRAPAALG